ncbi:MAG: TolB family protein, partial [Planctomycetota bacterium]
LGEGSWYREPEILPGGNAVLFSSSGGDIAVVFLKTGKTKILANNGYHARYLSTGHLVYAQAGGLVAAPFDLAALEVGEPVPVLEKVLLDSWIGLVQYTFSSNGSLVYVPGDDTARSIPVFVDRQDKEELLLMPAQIYGTPKVSPDGTHLAIVVEAGAKKDVYIYDIATGRSMRLTVEGSNTSPVWTPDGRRVTFSGKRENQEKWSIFWKPVDGSGDAELLYSSEYHPYPSSWSPNGKWLAFFESHPTTTKGDVWVLPLEGPHEPELIVETKYDEWGPAFSPDGRLIAYTSDRDGKFQVCVRPYPDNDWVRQTTTIGSGRFQAISVKSQSSHRTVMSCSTVTATNGWLSRFQRNRSSPRGRLRCCLRGRIIMFPAYPTMLRPTAASWCLSPSTTIQKLESYTS